MPPTYVSALFDQYAPKFEAVAGRRSRLSRARVAVQGGAGRARRRAQAGVFPARHRSRLRHRPRRRALSPAQTDEIIGIDLSPRMIELAARHRALCRTRSGRDRGGPARQAGRQRRSRARRRRHGLCARHGAAAERGGAGAGAGRAGGLHRGNPCGRRRHPGRGTALCAQRWLVRAVGRGRRSGAATSRIRIGPQRKPCAGAGPGGGRAKA